MRTTHRFATAATTTALAVLLAACGSSPTQPTAQQFPASNFPNQSSTGSFPSSGFPSSSSGSTAGTQAPAAATEFGRVMDIQTVQMGASGGSNPNVRRAIVGGIIGAVVGNVVGKSVGDGNYRSGATVLGGAAGAAAGARSGGSSADNTAASGAGGPAYRVVVQTDQGQQRMYEVGALGDLRVGDRVRVEEGVIYRS